MTGTVALPSAAFGAGWDVPAAPPTTEHIGVGRILPAFSVIAEWVKLPALAVEPAPQPQLQARELLKWTGLSRRLLAEMLGVTHPTLTAVTNGSGVSLSKKPETVKRLDALHSLVSRLATFEIKAPGAIASALLSRSADGARIGDLAASGDVTKAYLQALEVLAGPSPRTATRHITTTRSVGTATVALSD